MKKFFLTIVLLSLAISSFAQEKDVTKFLGIPVDGTKAEMIAKLKEKGFTSTVRDKDILEGEFNGRDVEIMISTNRDKVWRIIVADKVFSNESQIKTRFNNLCHQFDRNSNYYLLPLEQTISEDDDISYEMTVHSKNYNAVFYQKSAFDDNSNIDIENILKNDTLTEKEKQIKTLEFMNSAHKPVWFTIIESQGEYLIAIYYENRLNQADGEDL